MPGATSSNDLVLEMLRELLAERQHDMSEGLTLRALRRLLTEHMERNAQDFRELEGRVRKLEDHASRSDGRVETGSWILPPGGMGGAARNQIPPVSVNVETSRRSHRPSIPWLASAAATIKPAAKPIGKWLGIVLLVIASHLAARCGFPPPPAPAPAAHP
jgi:hypothetical protein